MKINSIQHTYCIYTDIIHTAYDRHLNKDSKAGVHSNYVKAYLFDY